MPIINDLAKQHHNSLIGNKLLYDKSCSKVMNLMIMRMLTPGK